MKPPSGRQRHSFIQFYFDDWLAGTARMPRPVRSIYFDFCCYTWAKVRAVPEAEWRIMVADLPNGEQMVDYLVESGQLVRGSKGEIHSPRALAEAQRAFDAWEAKSIGGRGGRDRVLKHSSEHSSKSQPIEPDPDPEPDIEEDRRRDSNLENGRSLVVVAWNEMARRHGLKQVVRMSAERVDRLDARLEEHGADPLVAGINLIPTFPFLLGQGENGWKAGFDWFLRPESFAHIVEGDYEPRRGKVVQSPPGPMNVDEASKANERLAEIGSGMRWRLEAGSWLLKPA